MELGLTSALIRVRATFGWRVGVAGGGLEAFR